MAFRDLDDFLVVQPIDLPIRGKVYHFPGAISAASGLRLERFTALTRLQGEGGDADPDELLLIGEDADTLEAEMFGGVKAEMIADGLTTAHISAVFDTLMAYHATGSLEVAERVWEDHAGESPAPAPATPQATPKARGSHAGSTGRQTKPATKAASATQTSSDSGS